jgi:hypothetical protein
VNINLSALVLGIGVVCSIFVFNVFLIPELFLVINAVFFILTPMSEEIAKNLAYNIVKWRKFSVLLICFVFVTNETVFKIWYFSKWKGIYNLPDYQISFITLSPAIMHITFAVLSLFVRNRFMWPLGKILLYTIPLHYAYNIARGFNISNIFLYCVFDSIFLVLITCAVILFEKFSVKPILV